MVVPLRSSGEGLVSWVEVDEARALDLRTPVLGASPGRAAIESRLILPKVVGVSIGVKKLSGATLTSKELAEGDHCKRVRRTVENVRTVVLLAIFIVVLTDK